MNKTELIEQIAKDADLSKAAINQATCAGCPTVRECHRITAECPNLAPASDSQHARDSAELRSLCQARDDARRQRDALAAEVADLRTQLEAVGAGGVSGRLMGGGVPGLKALFREALAWGLVCGPQLAAGQWDELAERKSESFAARAATLSAAPTPPTAQPADPAASFEQKSFQIALIKELAEVKQNLLATEGQLQTSQKMLGACERSRLEEFAPTTQPQQSTPAVPPMPDALDAARYRFANAHNLILFGGVSEFGWPIAPFGKPQWDKYLDAEMRRCNAAINPTGGTT